MALRDRIISAFRDSRSERNGSNYDISVTLEKPPRIDTIQVRTSSGTEMQGREIFRQARGR